MTRSEEFGELEATIRATVRTCTEADLPALEWMGLYSRDRAIIRRVFEAQTRGEALMLVAVAAKFPIAQVWVDFGADGGWPPARFWAIRTFFPLQRAGIGRRMMRFAEEATAARGVASAELEVDSFNRDVLGFYRRLGWTVIAHPAPGREDGRFLLTKDLTRPTRCYARA
ncbi:GNAT family N-acetyltransferase [Nitratireductor sp. GCM10026969]|uniref:GNAT family N-acetyltransferase n=1 Tax=Nitratireductor sp. GCM10026969 TaxID=3252645 RepID=UPI0036095A41